MLGGISGRLYTFGERWNFMYVFFLETVFLSIFIKTFIVFTKLMHLSQTVFNFVKKQINRLMPRHKTYKNTSYSGNNYRGIPFI